MKKISYISVIILVGIIVITYFVYKSFRNERLSELETGSQVAETPRGPLEYQIFGKTGPVILFIHGTSGGYDSGFPWPGYRVLSVSRPGYLRTPLSTGRTPDEQAHAYAALLEMLNINSVVVFGASGGGPSSIAFAALYPEKTIGYIGLFPISQSWRIIKQPAFTNSDFWLWFVAKILSNSFGQKIANFFTQGQGARQWIEMGPDMLGDTWPPSLREAGFLNDLTQFKELDLLNGRDISVPTLIIHGTADINVPFSQSKSLAERVSGSVLHPIEGGTHSMMSTHSEEIIPVMAEFISRLTNSSKE